MRKFGVLCASLAFAIAATAEAQEPFPDPPILVNTPSGTTVPVNLPTPTVAAQPYMPTAQPVVVPVPINFYVTPNIIQPQVPVTIPAPAPVFPQQPPQPRGNQACIPIDGRTPLPFDIPMDTPDNGPVTSTVLPPPVYAAMQRQPTQMAQIDALEPYPTNPLLDPEIARTVPYRIPAPQAPIPPYGTSYPAPSPYPPQPTQSLQPATVPPPGAPYFLDAQGRAQYIPQPGMSPLPGPRQWPGYTPVNYNQPQPAPMPQPQIQQQFGAQAGPFYATDAGLAPIPLPPELNPALNPNLTNPNTLVQLISGEQVRQAVWANAPMTIIDVRDDLVRDVLGHIPNDINVPLQPSQTFPARARSAIANPNLPIVVYCNDGINSSQAANMLANMGYKVYLLGVYSGWGNHLPTTACSACPQ